ncbi:hypothetical protein [Phenylobacterium sp.]|uniref:hypothetical protein n=1 Tax=Phenylobacterium sp. TaxID=1871053 RepID=UPI00122687E8|nr:hypothetical protein [Phenylobacterium sp.]THD65115.1 MAG: hypothetical protein E8A49_00105 [Phenylobacterium sp.]
MKHSPLAIAPMLLLLAACDARVQDISHAADSMRQSTEHMAAANSAATDRREAQIIDDAVKIQQQTLATDPEAAASQARYEVRPDPNGGYSVYDLNTGAITRLGAKQQAGLTRDRADEVAYSLQQDETADQFRAAAAARHGLH